MPDPEDKRDTAPPAVESLEEAYSPEYLRECASGTAREDRLQELKRRIGAGAYRIDAETVAEELLSRGDLDGD